MKIDVIGTGLAGLLAAAMLRKDCNAVWEAQESLPNNHSAVLRFRSRVVADVLNIPFKEVKAIKAVEPWRNKIADALSYSQKTNGTSTLRSVLSADGTPQTRYIAPSDFVQRAFDAVEAPTYFGHKIDASRFSDSPIISTMPMPSLMETLDYPRRSEISFNHRSGSNLVVTLADVDAYCSLYVPDPTFPAARISITGNELIAECYGSWSTPDWRKYAVQCAAKMGIPDQQINAHEVKQQKYAKILPIDEKERRNFILWASEEHNVYSLGRYATWRPGLLLDDAVNDVRVIQRLISNRGEAYSHKMKG